MMTIEHYNNGFKMKFSNPGSGMRGFSVKAADVTEIKVAVDHYYGGSSFHSSERRNCPLCRARKEKATR